MLEVICLRRLAFVISLIVACFSCSFAMAQEPVMIEYDGKVHQYTGNLYDLVVRDKPVYSDMSPIIFNDRALVPVREVCEAIGAQVSYSQNTQTVEIVDDSTYIRLKINDNTAIVNGYKTAIPDNVVPKLISMAGGNAKTMVPVRFVSETIGLDVQFDGDNGKILVDSSGRELATITPTAAPVPTPSATVAPTVVPTVMPTSEPTPEVIKSVISKISYTAKNDKISVTVKLDKKTEYSYFTLSEPERLVIDFPNTKATLDKMTYEINKGGVNALRVGVDENRTRLVIDADKIESYSFGASGNNVMIYLTAEEVEDVPSPTVVPTTKPTSKPTTKPTQRPQSTVVPTTTPTPTPAPTRKPIIHTATEKYVVIDPGHGGSDPGALGTLDEKEIRESDLTLSISKKVRDYVKAAGYKVYMTRERDIYKTLVERPAYANDLDAAVFVSIHINSAENSPEANGTEVYYAASNNDDSYGTTSEQLAKNLLKAMVKNMGSVNRGVKTAEHAVTKRSYMPSSLVEVGFISNEDELRNMTDEEYQDKIAKGIAEGILATLDDINIFG